MKQRIFILLTIAIAYSTMANADIRFSRRTFDTGARSAMSWSRQRSVASWNETNRSNGSSWNYKGTELNGFTHGGGFGQDAWNRNDSRSYRGESQWTATGRIEYQKSDIRTNDSYRYNYSYNSDNPRMGIRRLVSSNVQSGSERHYANGGGSESGRNYRYSSQSSGSSAGAGIIGKIVGYATGAASSSADEATAETATEDMGDRMFSASRDRNGNMKGQAGQAGDGGAPLGDGMATLALLAGALVAFKKWKKQ